MLLAAGSPVQYAVVAREAIWQLVVHHVHRHLIEVVAALVDVPLERPVLVGWQQRPLLFVQALAGRQRPVYAVIPFTAKPGGTGSQRSSNKPTTLQTGKQMKSLAAELQ